MMDVVQCIKQILKVILTCYIMVEINYGVYMCPFLTSETKTLIYKLNPEYIDKIHSLVMGFAPPSGNTKQCNLATLRNVTLVSQRAPAFIEGLPCIIASLPFREHP